MSAIDILRQWTRCVRDDLLAGVPGHQAKALACLSLGIVAAGHCASGRVAAAVPTAAKVPSVQRRMERLLANGRVRTLAVAGRLARSLLAGWQGRPLLLILD